MQILAVDTATKSCSVAIASEESLIAEATIVSSQTHSRHLMTLIDRVLQMAQLQIQDLDGFAVTKGPGSFTGLRIGIGVIKGLAAATDKPLLGVPTLDVLARQTGVVHSLIIPVIDARRQEVYFSRYRYHNGSLENETAVRALPIEKAIEGIEESCVFIGDGALLYREEISKRLGDVARFAPSYQHTIRGSTVALMGIERLLKGEVDCAETFVPYYVRKSDAEISSDNKKKH
ncbi:MAG: tRNA (adenosine(37)-N6)-threonylcarbamoyltransferase complex dimerization subunit type 1 TsaB [Deltaproteobacteria bacterium]|nr:tRNA (adenosine(37)-N6)-threonylcarbamoyltransferase complex dimerization subunit type 1 TsaB [Deltaproteobacteria bacterium]MBW1995994.1 tRNA (adenosine(37)-N6)-threonylcarbamoyltransferase complex dimerization subunit type 1 TsaB [Deltaproteobacteria bacterium]MBW2150937.1 tRNA (adenosine(37)-N6)-threonylcarbamoyltransferase complex dimerization subunit type 1 TsaB [Deltaproteobacteria bacterium]